MTEKEETPMLQENDVKLGDTMDTGNHGDHCHHVSEERHEVVCPRIGNINVYVQGVQTSSAVAILTVHDLGCDHTMYHDFIGNERMTGIRDRTVWVHVDIPGQGREAPDLPADYTFPTMQQVGEDLIHVLDQLKIREVVCFGEGAGANILARFAIAHQERVLGVVLLHCTGTTAGFMESIKDKVINWKLDHIGMNPTAEAYLVLHRFGSGSDKFSKAPDKEALKTVIENYQTMLRTKVNPKNLKKFVEAFLKRTNVADNIKRIKCPILFVTGSKSVFHRTTHILHEHMVKGASDKGKVELLQISGCANILEERPEKFIESFQYFLQGLGLVSSIPMCNISHTSYARSASMEEYDLPNRMRKARTLSGGSVSSIPMAHLKKMMPRMRSLSMEEYDLPKFSRQRTLSGGENNSNGTESPLSTSVPKCEPVPETMAN